jgi:toxin ParE1/3/4
MKRFTVIFTPRAERQLSALYVRIADDKGQATADNYIDGIVAECKLLATFPERGTRHDEIRPNLRTKGYARRATIAFSVNLSTEIVVIHGVFYGGQDFEQLIRDTNSDD